MRDLSLYPDQIMKQEQYKDLLREAEHYRLTKVVAQSRPNHRQKIAVALNQGVASLFQHLPSVKVTSRARV